MAARFRAGTTTPLFQNSKVEGKAPDSGGDLTLGGALGIITGRHAKNMRHMKHIRHTKRMKHTKHMKFGAENAREGEGAMARITALINQKGGVAKTTTAHALAVGLARQGRRVLAIDCDPQGNLSFSMRADDTLAGLYEALRGDAAPADVIQATRQGVDLIASSLDLSAADMEFTRVGREYLLRGLCDAVAASYDHIIVDCPPALGVLTLNALTAADDMVIPVGLEVFSLQGLKQLFNTVENVRRYCNPRLRVAGILITRHPRQPDARADRRDRADGERSERLSVSDGDPRGGGRARGAGDAGKPVRFAPQGGGDGGLRGVCRGLSQAGGREAWRLKRAGRRTRWRGCSA